jgi:cyclic-di-AMP phosphodiesterase PgpH
MKNEGILHFIRDRHAQFSQVVMFIITLASIVAFFPRNVSFNFEYHVSRPWTYETLLAPFNYEVYKQQEDLEREFEKAHSASPLYFLWDKDQSQYAVEKLSLAIIRMPEELTTSEAVLAIVTEYVLEQLNQGVVTDIYEFSAYSAEKSVKITFQNNVFRECTLGEIKDVKTMLAQVEQSVKGNFTEEEIGNVFQWIEAFVSPTLIFDLEETERNAQMAKAEIDSIEYRVLADEVVVQQGEIISPRVARKIDGLNTTISQRQGQFVGSHWMLAGQILSVGTVLLLLFIFLKVLRPMVLEDNTQVSFILLNVVLLSVLVSWLVHRHIEYLYLAPFCMLPLVIRAFYDSRLALFVHLTAILIIGIQVPNPFEFVFLQLLAGIITVLMVQNIYRRGELFSSALKIVGIYLLAYVSMTLIQQGSPLRVDTFEMALLAGSGVLSLFANPLIYFYEKTFSLVSDVTLLEYSDTNNPLLRQMSERAPGTFQHSLQVANLSESVVREIDGNTLLMRVGALYHDIGKVSHPVYFIENQSGGVNPHDELPFEESAAIIINHVKEGIALAKKKGVPDRIIDFIRTHHGTTTVQYFYKQYLKNYPDEMVEKSKFSYPGPLPYSKEMAVLMMADAVEAASRSLATKDAFTIEKLVDSIIDRLLSEGQFNQAQITLKEITTARAILKRKLLSVYHLRIEYPE